MNIPFLRQCLLALPLAGSALGVAAQVPPQALARATALATEAATALAPPGARVLALPGNLDPRLTLAPCGQVEPYLSAGVPAWGRTRVGLRCTEGAVRWNVFLPITVQVWAKALVSTSALPVGARISESQLSSVDTDWAAATQTPFSKPELLVGRTLTRAVAPGQALRANDVQPRQWFAIGDPVRILALGSGFSIDTEGQALTPGLEGQPARVRTESGRVLVGRAVGERRIEVSL